ncbi:MAG TPA: hypothetical protein PLX23_08555, partial [Candidatus Hydrogenedens sp.]|nr:hypothetical protein [Candidatus Hydrogenedens sp.]
MKSYQEFLLKLHSAIKYQYVTCSNIKKEHEENWRLLQEQLDSWTKSFERILLEKNESTEQIENLRNLLDEKIYALTTKENELESVINENKAKEEEIEKLKESIERLSDQVDKIKEKSIEGEVEVIEDRIAVERNEEVTLLEKEINRTKDEYEKLKQQFEEANEKYNETLNSNLSLQEELEKIQRELVIVSEQKNKEVEQLR